MPPLQFPQKGKNMILSLFLTTPTTNADLTWLTNVCFWLARCVILAVFCGFGLYRVVKGQTNEDVRERTEGITLVAVGGVLFASTFAIAAIF